MRYFALFLSQAFGFTLGTAFMVLLGIPFDPTVYFALMAGSASTCFVCGVRYGG